MPRADWLVIRPPIEVAKILGHRSPRNIDPIGAIGYQIAPPKRQKIQGHILGYGVGKKKSGKMRERVEIGNNR